MSSLEIAPSCVRSEKTPTESVKGSVEPQRKAVLMRVGAMVKCEQRPGASKARGPVEKGRCLLLESAAMPVRPPCAQPPARMDKRGPGESREAAPSRQEGAPPAGVLMSTLPVTIDAPHVPVHHSSSAVLDHAST